jgi:glycosyltransferase involved in cell wall biosynthesis
MTIISIIIPCYYNQENIPSTIEKLLSIESNLDKQTEFQYVFIDDGSKDGTYLKLLEVKRNLGNKVILIKLSGNFGSYNAILAGMKYATGSCNVILSADLQDPPELIPKMYDYWKNNFKLVIANRIKRDDNYIDKIFSNIFHKLIKKYGISNMPNGGFDFCLFDIKLKNEILLMNEKNTNTLFLLLWMKYDYISIPYERKKRLIGKSRWTIAKKIKLLIDSFISFSFAPIRMISIFGLIIGLITLVYAIFLFTNKLLGKINIEGWTTLMVVFLLTMSFVMFSLAILGEYLWRILDEVKGRPNYIIDKID